MKRYLSALILFVTIAFFIFPVITFAVQADLVNHPPIAPKGTTSDNVVKTVLLGIFDPMWQLAAGLAVIMFIVAGILFITSSGDPGKVTTAKKAAIWAVVGIIIAIIAFSIVTLVKGWII